MKLTDNLNICYRKKIDVSFSWVCRVIDNEFHHNISAIGYLGYSKWFEPRSISSSYSMIVRVSVVLRRTVVGD